MEIKFEGLDAFKVAFESIKRDTKKDIENIIEENCKRTVATIKYNTPVDTGYLRRSEGMRNLNASIPTFEIFAKADYAGYVEAYYGDRGKSFYYDNIDLLQQVLEYEIRGYFGLGRF